MIATGGTGGHIDPALALAEMLKQQIPDVHISFVGTDTRMEASLIPSLGYEYTGMRMRGMNGSVTDKILSAFSMLEAKIRCTKLLKDKKPDICIGFGNYISVPLILAACSMHIPTMIHEQNSFAGKANKLLGRYADAIVTCYHSTDSVFPKSRTKCLGNPMATLAAGYRKDAELIRSYGMNPDKPLVIVMAGSLGSETVSRTMDQAFPLLSEYHETTPQLISNSIRLAIGNFPTTLLFLIIILGIADISFHNPELRVLFFSLYLFIGNGALAAFFSIFLNRIFEK